MKYNYLLLLFGLFQYHPIITAQKLKSTLRIQAYPYEQFSDKLIREYNKNENRIKQIVEDFRGIPTRTSIYSVDDKGRMISDSTYNSDNKLIETSYYEYNDRDDIVLQKRFYLDDNVYYEERYERTYNRHGFETEVNEYNQNGELDWTYKYTYDAQGNVLKRLSIFKGVRRELFKKKYKKGLCVINKLYSYHYEKPKRRLAGFWVYEHDNQRRKIKMTAYSVSKPFQKKINSIHEYKYDNVGNRVEERVTKNGHLIRIIKTDNTYW